MLWICDVNGVLVDTPRIIREAFATTAARFGFRFDEASFRRVKAQWLVDAYHDLDPTRDPLTLSRVHLRYVRERLAQVRAYPAVHAMLSQARSAGVCIVAASSYGLVAEECLVRAGLYSLVDCVVTQEETVRRKPHPDVILRALELFDPGTGAELEHVVYVGDTSADIEAGHAAGVCTVAVTYGISDDAEIRLAQPDYVIDSFTEMRSFLMPWSLSQSPCVRRGLASTIRSAGRPALGA